mmetsp:Transcript_62000/g.108074  ORF Transcript_62000/g.108074 Transcript_62000/m.108074 type:complete len:202 (+) Transcript_62000:1142-1747(+)
MMSCPSRLLWTGFLWISPPQHPFTRILFILCKSVTCFDCLLQEIQVLAPSNDSDVCLSSSDELSNETHCDLRQMARCHGTETSLRLRIRAISFCERERHVGIDVAVLAVATSKSWHAHRSKIHSGIYVCISQSSGCRRCLNPQINCCKICSFAQEIHRRRDALRHIHAHCQPAGTNQNWHTLIIHVAQNAKSNQRCHLKKM